MLSKIIEVDSYVGSTLRQEFSTQESKTLVVILPGGWYTIFGPILFYSYNVGIELGYDVLTVEYGFQKMNMRFEGVQMASIIKESKTAIDRALELGNYHNIVFIAKCLGTDVFTNIVEGYLTKYRIVPVLITPVKPAMNAITAFRCLVIIGTLDQNYAFFKEALQLDHVASSY